MTYILLATGAFIGGFAVLGWQAMRHINEANDRPWDEYRRGPPHGSE